MSRWISLGAALIAALFTVVQVVAHEGHAHKVMGTVMAVRGNELDLKATDGKTSTVTLNEKTRILRGKSIVQADAIKPGERVVVTQIETKDKNGKVSVVASEVRLGSASAAAPK